MIIALSKKIVVVNKIFGFKSARNEFQKFKDNSTDPF